MSSASRGCRPASSTPTIHLRPISARRALAIAMLQGNRWALQLHLVHDPHARAASDMTRYERVCLNCHQGSPMQASRGRNFAAESRGAICPVSPSTGCLSCHMPRVDSGQHVMFTDHWIGPVHLRPLVSPGEAMIGPGRYSARDAADHSVWTPRIFRLSSSRAVSSQARGGVQGSARAEARDRHSRAGCRDAREGRGEPPQGPLGRQPSEEEERQELRRAALVRHVGEDTLEGQQDFAEQDQVGRMAPQRAGARRRRAGS